MNFLTFIVNKRLSLFLCIILTMFLLYSVKLHASEILPSWKNSIAKTSITGFVKEVTDPESNSYVKPEDRIAVFDNDGTLWVEKPLYTQLAFAIDRLKTMAPRHPEWKTTEPYKSILEGNYSSLDKKGLMKILAVTHSDITTEEFEEIAEGWFKTVKHPRYKRPYTELVYQPMIEVLEYLRANEFKTFIVSGGGIDFMRPVTQKIYGIPAEQVIGTSTVTKYKLRNGKPVLVKMPEIFFIDDKEGKPVGIHKFIGKRPIIAFGNSDGDLEMLLWTTTGKGKRLGMIVHHDDAKREYSYDRESHIGRLDKAMDMAEKQGWVLISMKNYWKTIFPFEN